MTISIARSAFAAMFLLAAGCWPMGAARAETAARPIADNSAIFIDGTTLQVTERTSKNDTAQQVARLGARELGAGAIFFRVGDRLYVADAGTAPRHPPVAFYDPATARRLGFVYDADYANWRLKKIFGDLVGTSDRK
jgi:hypothetical protein